MPADPTVCAVLLTRDRPEMAARAVRCFRRQTYEKSELFILDTGKAKTRFDAFPNGSYCHEIDDGTIGHLRNVANAATASDIICHWDDDDISHPNRIAEQVALLQSSGADCVGYREMLFWKHNMVDITNLSDQSRKFRDCGESWIYAHSHPNYCLGTSLCYWRKAWENCKFPPTSRGEDLAFVQRVRALGVSGVNGEGEPRMVATIHGSNTSESYDSRLMAAKEEWRRTPEWDDAVRKMLEES